MIHDRGSKNDPSHNYFMIQIMISAWSGSKNRFFIFDLDQKSAIFFLIWIKKTPFHFWSGSKKLFFIFDPGSKNIHFWIKDHEIKKWSTVLIHDLPTVKNMGMVNMGPLLNPYSDVKICAKKTYDWHGCGNIGLFFHTIGQKIAWFGFHELYRSCTFRKIEQFQ